MENLALAYLNEIADAFVNPQKRVFVGYLATAAAIAVAFRWIMVRRGGVSAARNPFGRNVWWSASARLDYKILLLNGAVAMAVAPRLLTKLAVATVLFEAMHVWFGGRVLIGQTAPAWLICTLFTLCLFVLDDASRYLVHRALHRWPLLWCFHKTHHTAERLTPLTVYRTHPVEGVLFALRIALVQGATIAVFLYFFGSRVDLVSVLGANVFLFVFNAAGSNLRHMEVPLSYGRRLERILISPAQHQIHHSIDPRHHDRNFGAALAIWDWLGGTLYLAGKDGPVTYGVRQETTQPHDLRSAYLTPFANAARYCHDLIAARPKDMLKPVKTRKSRMARATLALTAAICIVALPAVLAAQELNIYSHRQPFLIKPFIDAYTAKTGTDINIVYASKGLAQRLQAEGARSPADVVLTVDIARLHVYADKDLLAPVDSVVLKQNIPSRHRDPGERWFAFSKRARVIAVSKKAADTIAIARYEDLADPKWRGRICVRPGSHVYNRALVASMIDAHGVEKAEAWAKGLVENLARRPQGNDRAQVKAIYEGVCDIAIINNYYYGKLKFSDKPAQRDWAAAARLIFPNQGDRGAHVNISGGGVAKHSKHKAEAVRFLEFLTTQPAQALYGAVNFEYPVNPSVPPSEELRSWGTFSEDKMPISRIAELAPQAQRVIDRVGW